jgi:hypothetical protein|tara:strand:+ start:16317 stop:17846 length:1530 start_codon:yes stop_codon:yes gene_type:complete
MTAFTADQYIDGQFTWFTGVIEDRMDPEKMGRVRVRCFGFHSDSRGLIKTTDLPWATVMMPATGSTMSGIGNTPHALLPGTWVVGFFRDGPSAQDPIIMGSIGGMPDTKPDSAKGFSDPSGNYPTIVGEPDVNRLARGINTSPYDVDVSISEPAVPFAATYPHNKVIETESGHKIELDDTPGAERIRVHHHSGSFIEMHPEGDVVFRQKNKYDIVIENDNCHVQGNINLLVDGNVKQFIRGNLDVFTAGNMSFKSGGNISFDAAGGYTEAASTIHMNSAPANPFGPDAQRLVLALAGANAAFDDDELGENADLVVPSEDIPVKQVITPDTTPEVAKPSPVLQSCDGITDANITDSMLLSPNFTLARLSSGAVFKHTVQAQAGNTKADIVCNLKALATNILEPLLAQYPGIRVNSGFRTVTKGKSQHEHGMACDIQWPGISNKEYLVRAQWIKANLPYDQLIFEHGNSIWLHLSHSRVLTNNNIPQRNKVLTYYPKVSPQYKPGITLHYA